MLCLAEVLLPSLTTACLTSVTVNTTWRGLWMEMLKDELLNQNCIKHLLSVLWRRCHLNTNTIWQSRSDTYSCRRFLCLRSKVSTPTFRTWRPLNTTRCSSGWTPCSLQVRSTGGVDVVAHAFIPALGRQRHANLCEFKACLLYILNSKSAWTKRRPCLKQTRKIKRPTGKGWSQPLMLQAVINVPWWRVVNLPLLSTCWLKMPMNTFGPRVWPH